MNTLDTSETPKTLINTVYYVRINQILYPITIKSQLFDELKNHDPNPKDNTYDIVLPSIITNPDDALSLLYQIDKNNSILNDKTESNLCDVILLANYIGAEDILEKCCLFVSKKFREYMQTDLLANNTFENAERVKKYYKNNYSNLPNSILQMIITYSVPTMWKLNNEAQLLPHHSSFLTKCLETIPFSMCEEWINNEYPVFLANKDTSYNYRRNLIFQDIFLHTHPFSGLCMNPDPDAVKWLLAHPETISYDTFAANPCVEAIEWTKNHSYSDGDGHTQIVNIPDYIMQVGMAMNTNPEVIDNICVLIKSDSYLGNRIPRNKYYNKVVLEKLVLNKSPYASKILIEDDTLLIKFRSECSAREDDIMVQYLLSNPKYIHPATFRYNRNILAINYIVQNISNFEANKKARLYDWIYTIPHPDAISYPLRHWQTPLIILNQLAANPHDDAVRKFLHYVDDSHSNFYELIMLACQNPNEQMVDYIIESIRKNPKLFSKEILRNPNPRIITFAARFYNNFSEGFSDYSNLWSKKSNLLLHNVFKNSDEINSLYKDAGFQFEKDTTKTLDIINQWFNLLTEE